VRELGVVTVDPAGNRATRLPIACKSILPRHAIPQGPRFVHLAHERVDFRDGLSREQLVAGGITAADARSMKGLPVTAELVLWLAVRIRGGALIENCHASLEDIGTLLGLHLGPDSLWPVRLTSPHPDEEGLPHGGLSDLQVLIVARFGSIGWHVP
jgi:hypothetical protein